MIHERMGTYRAKTSSVKQLGYGRSRRGIGVGGQNSVGNTMAPGRGVGATGKHRTEATKVTEWGLVLWIMLVSERHRPGAIMDKSRGQFLARSEADTTDTTSTGRAPRDLCAMLLPFTRVSRPEASPNGPPPFPLRDLCDLCAMLSLCVCFSPRSHGVQRGCLRTD
jgi:hypothetical protein